MDIFTAAHPLWQEKINVKTGLAYFIISCGFPACFYLSYIYCGNILQNKFGYTSNQVISQNFIVALLQSLSFLCYSLCSYKINPLKILNFRICFFIPILLLSIWWLDNFTNPNQVLIFQCMVIVFGVMDWCRTFYKSFSYSKKVYKFGAYVCLFENYYLYYYLFWFCILN